MGSSRLRQLVYSLFHLFKCMQFPANERTKFFIIRLYYPGTYSLDNLKRCRAGIKRDNPARLLDERTDLTEDFVRDAVRHHPRHYHERCRFDLFGEHPLQFVDGAKTDFRAFPYQTGLLSIRCDDADILTDTPFGVDHPSGDILILEPRKISPTIILPCNNQRSIRNLVTLEYT